jgi:hypothetical protein
LNAWLAIEHPSWPTIIDSVHIPSDFVVERARRSLKASRREDLQIEEPVCGGSSPAFHFHAALTGMLGTTLIGDQVIQMGQPCEKRLLTAAWMVKRFHHEQFPFDSIMGLIQ